MRTWRETFLSLSIEQHGLVGRWQLRDRGLEREHWRLARTSGLYVHWSSRVLQLNGVPATQHTAPMAAVLHEGPYAFLAGDCTLALFGMHGFGFNVLQVARQKGLERRGDPGVAEVHILTDLRAADVTVFRGIPTMTPLRALWFVAGRSAAPHRYEHGVEQLRALVQQAVRRRLVTLESLHDSVEALRDRGRNGTRIMRTVAEDLPVGSIVLESRNEDRFVEVVGVAAAGLTFQRTVGGTDLIGRVDARDAERPLAIEINSMEFHSLPIDRAHDERRHRRLVDAGFNVLVVWDDDLWKHPPAVRRALAVGRQRTDAGERDVLHTAGCPWPGARTLDRLDHALL